MAFGFVCVSDGAHWYSSVNLSNNDNNNKEDFQSALSRSASQYHCVKQDSRNKQRLKKKLSLLFCTDRDMYSLSPVTNIEICLQTAKKKKKRQEKNRKETKQNKKVTSGDNDT